MTQRNGAVEQPEDRKTFSTRISPSVRFALRREVNEVLGQGKRINIEDVVEELIRSYTTDADFREQVNARILERRRQQ